MTYLLCVESYYIQCDGINPFITRYSISSKSKKLLASSSKASKIQLMSKFDHDDRNGHADEDDDHDDHDNDDNN